MNKTIFMVLALCSSFAINANAAEGPFYEFNGVKFKLDRISDWSKVLPEIRRDEISHIDLSSYPKTMDLSSTQTIVKSQGERGACTFFALNGLIEGSLKTRFDQDVNLSEEYAAYVTKGIEGTGATADGSWIYYNALAIDKHGIVLETDAPYQGSWFRKGLPCDQSLMEGESIPARCYSHDAPKVDEDRILHLEGEWLDGFKPEENQLRSELIVKAMNEHGVAMSASVPVDTKLWNGHTGVADFDHEAFVKCTQTAARENCGGHAIVLTGYDLDQRVFFFKNSWSSAWGNKGYGTISFDYIDNWAYQPYTLYVVPSKPLETPTDYSIETTVDEFEISVTRFDEEGADVSLSGIFSSMPFSVSSVYADLYYKDESGTVLPIEFDYGRRLTYPVSHFITDSRGEYDLSSVDLTNVFSLKDVPEKYKDKEIALVILLIDFNDLGYHVSKYEIKKLK